MNYDQWQCYLNAGEEEMTEDEERLEKVLRKRGITDPEKIEEYKKGLRVMKQIFGDIPEHIRLSYEIIQRELSYLDELAKKLGHDWTEEELMKS